MRLLHYGYCEENTVDNSLPLDNVAAVRDHIVKLTASMVQKPITVYFATANAENMCDSNALDGASPTRNALCYVCEKDCGGAHSCVECGRAVHAICGSVFGGEEAEGYGANVVCFKCRPNQAQDEPH